MQMEAARQDPHTGQTISRSKVTSEYSHAYLSHDLIGKRDRIRANEPEIQHEGNNPAKTEV
jgi:hypothetical protein